MMEKEKINNKTLTKKDFVSDQAVRWCPGCGDHVILAALQKTLAACNLAPENVVFVSGIGCSSRLPYYLNTFGIHSIHGRAPAIASGVKLANPELSIWVATGDGDGLAIGGNHFIHAIRRNINMNIIVFNNNIYALTGGQYSPTTPFSQKTSTTPDGSYERPTSVGELTIGSQGTFFARVADNEPKQMEEVFKRAYNHQGTSVVEILQNCVIFTDKIHETITGKDTKNESQLRLEHGEPMIFGGQQKYGLKLNGMKLDTVPLNDDENPADREDIIRHDAKNPDPNLHYALIRLSLPDMPFAMGVIRETKDNVYEQDNYDSIRAAQKKSQFNSIFNLIHSGNTWKVQ